MRRRGERGFSLLEMMAVVAILLILGAMASPSLMRAIRSYRLESSTRQIADILKRTRYEAMRRNQRIATAYQAPTGARGAELGIDFNMNGSLDTGEPRAQMPPYLFIYEWSYGPYGVSWPDYTNTMLGTTITFGPDGTALEQSGGNWQLASNIPSVYLYTWVGDNYIVTVTPAGNVKSWKLTMAPPWGWQQMR